MAGSLSPIVRLGLQEDLQRDQPKPHEWEQWSEAKALQYNISVKRVNDLLARYVDISELNVRRKLASSAQKIADLVGASRTEVIKRLRDGLYAKKVKVLNNRDGEETGRIEMDDWDAIISSAKELNRIHGNYAPEQINVNYNNADEDAVTLEEATRRLEEIYIAFRTGTGPIIDVTPERLEGEVSGGQETPGADSGTQGAVGPLLLPDGMHEDG